MIWIVLIIIAVVLIIAFNIKKKVDKDNNEVSILEKFGLIITGLNEYCYRGEGTVKENPKNNITIYKQGSCQIVGLGYQMGFLTIVWKFKYWQQEMVYKKEIDVRKQFPDGKPTIEWQENVLTTIISEFLAQYKEHEAKVDASGITGEMLSNLGIDEGNYRKAKEIFNKV